MKKALLKSTFVLFLSILIVSSLSSQIIYVNKSATPGGDGTSWASPFDDLQTALASAVDGDEIRVAEGSYFVNGNTDTSFEIPSGVAVYGGYSGVEGQSRDWESFVTILDGVFNIHTIVYFEDSNTNTILDGFTIQNGFADGVNSRGHSGAAIYIELLGSVSSPKIANCTIKDNSSDNNGGAIYIDGSVSGTAAPIFENCIFEGNSSTSDGGVLYGSGVNGGHCNPTFEKCTFKDNTASISGGAIFLNGSGNGIDISGDATATFKNCDFENNIANGNGGAIYTLGTSLGIANHTIINSRFYANNGFAAGALYHNGVGGDCSPTITNCTFYLNEATGAPAGLGGAIYNNGGDDSNGNLGNSSPVVSNCIIYGNIAPFGSHVFRNIDGTPTIRYSLVDADDCNSLNSGEGSNVTCGDGMMYNINPFFEDQNTGNLRLQEFSLAINVGHNPDNNEPEDLDGNLRKINNIDLGAYESPDGALPVELAEFRAYLDDTKVTLSWITLSEQDNAGFTVERSANGRDFEPLTTLPGAGNVNTLRSYKAYDYHPMSGANYYRIKNISYSGEIDYSPVRIVELVNKKINLYPNPVADHLTVTFSDFNEDEAQFSIYNIYGKQVYSGITSVENNVSFIALPQIGSFVPGSYILKVHTSQNGSYSQRFLKIRD